MKANIKNTFISKVPERLCKFSEKKYIYKKMDKKELEKSIDKLYENITHVYCKDLNYEYYKKRMDYIVKKSGKLIGKQMTTKDYKKYKKDVIEKEEEFKKTNIYKLYYEELTTNNGNHSKINKSISRKYNIESKKNSIEKNRILKIYEKTKSYLDSEDKQKKLNKQLLNEKITKELIECVYKNCKNDFIVIIQQMIKFLKDNNKTNSKEYKYLIKINLESISTMEYKTVLRMMNAFIEFNLFPFV